MLANRSIPQSSVIPELAYPDVGEAIGWLCKVFGFTLRLRIANHRAQLNAGDGAIVLTELTVPQAERNRGQVPMRVDSAHAVMLRVENVDVHYERSSQSGARIVRPPATYPYGERQYSVEDFAGHLWTFSQSVADVDPREWGGEPGQL